MTEEEGIKKALVVGISEYTNDLQTLGFCKKDGEEMYKLLKNLGYEITSALIGDVNWITMRTALLQFFTNRNIKPNDTLLFYFSGHGIPDDFGDHYLGTP
jgi:Caspase domain